MEIVRLLDAEQREHVVELDFLVDIIEVPLRTVKEYKYCKVLKKEIPIHFRQVFELRREVFYWSDEYYKVWKYYTSKEIK